MGFTSAVFRRRRRASRIADVRNNGNHPYLSGPYYFDLETKRVLGRALEMVCLALRTGDCDDHVKQAIANKLIALAKTGERNPEVLCD